MIYAKIDKQGNVLEFPYNFVSEEIPDNAVEVDTTTNLSNMSWDTVQEFDEVVLESGTYIMTFTTRDRYSNSAEKLKAIKELKLSKMNQNDRELFQKIDQLDKNYSAVEVKTWSQQKSEADLYMSDNTATPPLLTGIAASRGITLDLLCTKVVEKSWIRDNAIGSILGKYRKNNDLLNSIDLKDDTTWNNIDLVEKF